MPAEMPRDLQYWNLCLKQTGDCAKIALQVGNRLLQLTLDLRLQQQMSHKVYYGNGMTCIADFLDLGDLPFAILLAVIAAAVSAYACIPDRRKIGSTFGPSVDRIAQQIFTSTPDKPKLLFEVKTSDRRALEGVLHGHPCAEPGHCEMSETRDPASSGQNSNAGKRSSGGQVHACRISVMPALAGVTPSIATSHCRNGARPQNLVILISPIADAPR